MSDISFNRLMPKDFILAVLIEILCFKVQFFLANK